MLGDQIEIVVVEIKGDQVKLGIKAPREMTILRSEIYREIKAENELAIQTTKAKDINKTLGSLFGGTTSPKQPPKSVPKIKLPKKKR
jgi:carbon storage regulator